jgi:PilZ domain
LRKRRIVLRETRVQKEQRRHPRYTVDLSATFFNDRTSGLAKVGDISLGGCRIESHVVVALNEIGQLLIELPGSHPLKVSHTVVRWVLGKKCGLEFLKVDADDQGWLNTITSRT